MSTTSLHAFLCATGQSQNNSAAQGQLFYVNFTSVNQALNYDVHFVDNCGGGELIWDGTTSDGSSAFTVSANAMMNGCMKPEVECFRGRTRECFRCGS